MIISIEAEKTFHKVHYLFMIKNLPYTGLKRNLRGTQLHKDYAQENRQLTS